MKNSSKRVSLQAGAIFTAIILAAGLATPANAGTTVTGAGSTFVKNLLDICIPQFNAKSGNTVTYAAGGSGAGRRQFNAGTVDFGMSDVAYTASEAQPTGKFVYVPITTGSIVIFAKLAGVKNLNLSPETVAGIFAGTITKWNDPKIVADNTVVDAKTKKKTVATLPATAITVWYRQDNSGTTSVFTDWLSKTAPTTWSGNRKVNGTFTTAFGGTVPAGTFQAGNGSDAVANGVDSKEGSVGYAEISYATERKLLVANLKNNVGEFIAPNQKSVGTFINGFAAGSNGAITIDYAAKVKGGYTLAAYVYALGYNSTAGKSAVNQSIVQSFYSYVLNDCASSADAAKAGYAPLTGKLKDLSEGQILQIK